MLTPDGVGFYSYMTAMVFGDTSIKRRRSFSPRFLFASTSIFGLANDKQLKPNKIMTEEVKDRATGSEENRPYQNGTYTRHTVAIMEDNTAEDVLQAFAWIVRGILCILAAVVFIVCIACLYYGVSERVDLLVLYFLIGLLTAVIIVILAFLFWARIQVIVNISLTLKKINSKIK